MKVRRRHRRIPAMRLFFSTGVVGSMVLVGGAAIHAIRTGAVAPRAAELWWGYVLLLTATTWLFLSEDNRRSVPVMLALVLVFIVVEVLGYFLHF